MEAGLDKLFGKEVQTKSDIKLDKIFASKPSGAPDKFIILKVSSNNNLSLYAGTFDLIDKEGDDQTSLFGIEHKNPNLFRDTFLGKFSPISGGFVTGKSAVYLIYRC